MISRCVPSYQCISQCWYARVSFKIASHLSFLFCRPLSSHYKFIVGVRASSSADKSVWFIVFFVLHSTSGVNGVYNLLVFKHPFVASKFEEVDHKQTSTRASHALPYYLRAVPYLLPRLHTIFSNFKLSYTTIILWLVMNSINYIDYYLQTVITHKKKKK